MDGSDSAEKVYLAVRMRCRKRRNVQKMQTVCLCVRRIVSDSVGFGRIGGEWERRDLDSGVGVGGIAEERRRKSKLDGGSKP